MPGAPGLLEFQFNTKDLARIQKKLEKMQGKPLGERMRKATLAAADLMVKPIRAQTPKGPTGHLRRYVKARPMYKRYFNYSLNVADIGWRTQTFGALVGPTSPHRHLVIRGHRIVTPGGRDTGRSTRPNPFVDRATRGHQRDALRIVKDAWIREGWG